MISTQSIASAFDSIDFKKANLRKAYDDLQAHSYFLSSFTLQWKDLEEHFESIQKSIQQRFTELQLKEKGKEEENLSVSKQSTAVKESESPPKPKNSDDDEAVLLKQSSPVKNSDDDEVEAEVVVNQELKPKPSSLSKNKKKKLKAFCSNMNGMGLLSFVTSNLDDDNLHLVEDELGDALKSAPDPAKLVLDAMLGFYPSDSGSEDDLVDTRRACILLLEKLNDLSALLDFPVSEKAYNLAVEWKGKINMESKDSLEALGFLHLSATYGLSSAFKPDELIDIVVTVSGRKEAPDLCRWLGLTDKLQDLIQKLRVKGLHLDAIEFLYAFDVVNKYPVAHFLKGYLKHSRKLALETRTNGKNSYESQLEATSIELAAVRAIMKCVVEHKLESEYPLENLEKLTETLEKQKPSKKRQKNVAGQQSQTEDDKLTTPTPSNVVPVVETSVTNGSDIQKSGDTHSRSTSPLSQSQTHGPYKPPSLRSAPPVSQSQTHVPYRPPNLLNSSAQCGGVPGPNQVSQPQSHPVGFSGTPAHYGNNLGSETQAHCRPMSPLPGLASQYMSSPAPYGSMPSPNHGIPHYMNPAHLGSPAQYGSIPGSRPFTQAQGQYHPQGPLPNPASPYMSSSAPYGSTPHTNHAGPPYASAPHPNHGAPPPHYMSSPSGPYAGNMGASPVNYPLQQQPPIRPNFY